MVAGTRPAVWPTTVLRLASRNGLGTVFAPHFDPPPATSLPSLVGLARTQPLRSALDPGSLRPSSWGLAAAPLAVVQFLIPDGPSLLVLDFCIVFANCTAARFFDVGRTAVLKRYSRLRSAAKAPTSTVSTSAHGGSPLTWIQYSPIEPGQQGGNTAQQPQKYESLLCGFRAGCPQSLSIPRLSSRLLLALSSDESSFARFSINLPGGDIATLPTANKSPLQLKAPRRGTGPSAKEVLCDLSTGSV